MALDNEFERKLLGAGVWEPLSTILSTESPERTSALGKGVKEFSAVNLIPTGFVGTARVGTALYVGDGLTITIASSSSNASSLTSGTLDAARLPTLTKAMVGLNNVDNTSDANKPASTATIAARDAALIQAGVYTTEALGRANTADGQAFKVQGDGVNIAAYEYRRSNVNSSSLIATYPHSYVVTKLIPDLNKNINYLNVFDKNHRDNINNAIIANTGAIALGQGNSYLSHYIAVTAGETLYLNNLPGNLSLFACFDSSLSIVPQSSLLASTFVVPAGTSYIRYTSTAASVSTTYVSRYYAQYFDYGLTVDSNQKSLFIKYGALPAYKSAITCYSGVKNLGNTVISGVIVNSTTGEFTTGVHSYNRMIEDKIPVVPSSSIILTQVNMTTPYVAEYNIDHTFIKTGTISTANAYTVSSNAYYVYVGFYYSGTLTSTTLEYVTTPNNIVKPVSSVSSDYALQVYSSTSINNVALFSTLNSSNNSALNITPAAEGFVLSCNSTAAYSLFNVLPSIAVGEDYQISIDYELTDINCSSVDLRCNPYIAPYYGIITLTANNLNIRGTWVYEPNTTVTSSNKYVGLSIPTVVGSKIDPGLSYYAKILIRNVSVIRVASWMKRYQSIERLFGRITAPIEYISGNDKVLYDKYATANNMLGYSINRIDDVETIQRRTANNAWTATVNPSILSADQSLNVKVPSVFWGTNCYVYYLIDVTLTALDADKYNMFIRGLASDNTITFTQADIGIPRKIKYVAYGQCPVNGALGSYILLARQYIFTNEIANTSFSGGAPTCSITINSFKAYMSEKHMPISYQANFFDNPPDADLTTDFVKLPIKQLYVNSYGDSITEHDYAKYINCMDYDFYINYYGLRGPVSDTASGLGTGAWNTTAPLSNTYSDIIMTMFGAHDFGHDCQIGTLGTFDTMTYIGAYEMLIQKLMLQFPSKLIVACAAPPRNSTSSDSEYYNYKNAGNVSTREYAEALNSVCKLYGIPFVDTFAESGANKYNMTGISNLYNANTSTNNTSISITGVVSSNTGFFVSDYIPVSANVVYGAPTAIYYAEYSSNTAGSFIRRNSTLMSTYYKHPSANFVRLIVPTSVVVVNNTPIGVANTRFWFADQANATMPDRIHPNDVTKRRMGAAIGKVLKPVLDARRTTMEQWGSISNNADTI